MTIQIRRLPKYKVDIYSISYKMKNKIAETKNNDVESNTNIDMTCESFD